MKLISIFFYFAIIFILVEFVQAKKTKWIGPISDNIYDDLEKAIKEKKCPLTHCYSNHDKNIYRFFKIDNIAVVPTIDINSEKRERIVSFLI